MAGPDAFAESPGARRWLWLAAGVLLLAGLGYALWSLSTMTVGRERKAEPTTQALLLPPPPPPPPPPPQEKPPEPVEIAKPVPTEMPEPTPAKAEEAPAAVSIDAAATGAGDAYGLAGGGPGGMGAPGSTGTGTGPAGGAVVDKFYRQGLSRELESRIQRDPRLRRQLFKAELNLWIDGRGRVSRAELVGTTGDPERDRQLVAILRQIDDLDPPPASITFPAAVVVRGQKSL